ncbi:MAG: hypothetical protein WDN26_05705 [Chitinophagaceae bacterium]
MSYLRNNKTLVFIIAVLLLSNIALLYFFVWKDQGKKQDNKSFREYMVETLKKEVGFNDGQIAQYEEMSAKHKEAMKSLFDDIKAEKDSLYKLLLQPQLVDSVVNHHLNMIGEKQRSIDQKIFSHFLSLREVCTAEQRPKYDSLVQRMTRKMINPQKKDDRKKDTKK